MNFKISIFSVAFAVVGQLNAVALTANETEFFENKIRPILVTHCYKCHSQEAAKLKGGLSVEYRSTLIKGGDGGPAVVPGDPEKSILIKAVRYTDPDLQMPPKGEKLSDAQIADLTTWVRMGAPDPRVQSAGAKPINYASEKDHWSFLPIKKQPVPEVKAKEWVATPVDAFILAKLEQNGMTPSPVADKRTLIRRATFDLTGLPPSLKEVNDFLADKSPDAFAKVVDRLLASPQYGERWGRHWLDTARYSDTKGEVRKNREDFRYPDAWTYRDYVIRAFNEDKPFNKFIIEQIAADKLSMGSDKSTLAALGFLTLGAHFNGSNNDIINDRIDVVTKGFLGLTVSCARCHDHKFDPIPQKDYYSLHGIFASSAEPEIGALMTPPKMTPEYLDYAKKYNDLNQELTTLKTAKRKNRGKEIKKEEIDIRRDMAKLEMTHAGAPPRAMVLLDKKVPADSPVFIRGEAENKGEIVPRRFLEILSGKNRPAFKYGSGRLELASAIANTANPLTSRVLVNRVWLHHFGEGFVTTPDDFGNQSEPPSHPELLDFLATKFMEEGWSLKKLHKLIMLSNVYQQSSESNPRYAQKDPNNRLLWRANIQRLEFEATRDSILAIGGKLDLTMGGRPVNLGAPSNRRTIYGYVDRLNLPELYNQFDFANPDISSGKRYETIVPQQSLFLMNSPLVVEQARNLINRPDFKNLENPGAKIRLLYDLVFQREPTETEIKLGLAYVEESPATESVQSGDARPNRREERKENKKNAKAPMSVDGPKGNLRPLGAWEKLAHALLQTNEALFIN